MMTSIRKFVAALIVTFAFVNSAAAQLPATQLVAAPTAEELSAKKAAGDHVMPVLPVQMRGWLDRVDYQYPFDETRVMFGWAMDLRVPNRQLAVRLYDGPNKEGRPLEPLTTNVYRPDVNLAFKYFGASGEHGFRTNAPIHLCNGKERAIHAYALDPFTAEEIELDGSPQTLLCAPKDGNRWIQGVVTNKRFGTFLPSQGYFGTTIDVVRIDANGNKSLFNYSNCETWNGCVDQSGTFMFFTDHLGNQPIDGDYLMNIRVNDHLEKTIRFTLPMTGHLDIQMDIVPASVKLVDQAWTISKHGGSLWAKVQIINYEATDLEVSMDSLVQGPSLTKRWNQYEISGTVPLSSPWTHYEKVVEIPIDPRLPNNESYCASVKVGKVNSKIEPYQEVSFCAVKR